MIRFEFDGMGCTVDSAGFVKLGNATVDLSHAEPELLAAAAIAMLDFVFAELRRAKQEEDPFLPLGHYLEHGPIARFLEERP